MTDPGFCNIDNFSRLNNLGTLDPTTFFFSFPFFIFPSFLLPLIPVQHGEFSGEPQSLASLASILLVSCFSLLAGDLAPT